MIVDDIPGLRRILKGHETVAMVGLSDTWHRPSNFAAKYLLEHGFRVIPVNPRYDEILGQRCYPSLDAIPDPVEVVDCFRRAEDMPPLAEAAVAVGAKVLWMQLGVVSQEAAEIASAAGLDVVMNRCMKIEYGRLYGGLSFIGVNTKVISAKRPMWIPY